MVEVEITQNVFDFVKGRSEKGYYPQEIRTLCFWHQKVKISIRQVQLIQESSDMGTLTQKETAARRVKIKTIFENQLKGPFTSTLDVKEELRRQYPAENWQQHHVSTVLQSIHDAGEIQGLSFNDNGHFREYLIITPQAQATNQKIAQKISGQKLDRHTLEMSDGSLFKGTKAQVETMSKALGIDLHYSQTKQMFIPIQDMQKNHLENVIKNDLEDRGSSLQDLIDYFENSVYIKAWKEKYAV